MGKIKRLAGETVLYGLGSILPKFLNFLLVRLHTDVFPPDEYGVLTKLLAYVAVINVVFTFGMETAYFRFSVKEGGDEKKVFNITQSVVIFISAVFSGIGIVFSDNIASAMQIPGQGHLIIWLVGIMFIDAVVSIPFARLRFQKKATRFASYRLINIFILIGLNIYFLRVAYDPAIGINYVFLANIIANGFYLLIFLRTLASWRPTYHPVLTPKIITYGYPVMLTGLAGMTNEMFSRQTLDWWLPEGFYPGQSAKYAVGIFGACYKFGVLMNLTVQAFRYAAEPFFFSNAVDKESPTLFANINHYFVIVCCVILLGVSINLDIIRYFIKNAVYWEGMTIVPILLLGYLFLGVYYNISVWFKLTDKTYYGTFITLGGAFITIAGNYWLIPVAGYMGSSWAMLLCYFAMAVACYRLGQKYHPIPYKVKRDMLYIVVTTIIVYAVQMIELPDQWLATAFHVGVILIYLFIIYLIERKDFKVASR